MIDKLCLLRYSEKYGRGRHNYDGTGCAEEENGRLYRGTEHSVTMDELCQMFQVSMNTIQADMASLVQTGVVEKVYGRVRSNLCQEVLLFTLRAGMNVEAKRQISRQDAAMIRDGDTIFVDSGTTTMHLLDSLDSLKHITVLTGNLHLVTQATNKPNVELIVLPGVMNRRINAVADGSTLEYLKRYHCEKAFMAVSSISPDGKLNVSSYIEYELKSLALSQSRETYLLVDSSKFWGGGLMSYGTLLDFDEIIADSLCPADARAFCAQNKLRLTIVGR